MWPNSDRSSRIKDPASAGFLIANDIAKQGAAHRDQFAAEAFRHVLDECVAAIRGGTPRTTPSRALSEKYLQAHAAWDGDGYGQSALVLARQQPPLTVERVALLCWDRLLQLAPGAEL